MNIMIGILKFPPDFTGAGLRIEKMYSRFLKMKKLNQILVFTTTHRNIKNFEEKRNRMNVFFVGNNNYLTLTSPFLKRAKKFVYIFFSSFSIIYRYLKAYKHYDIVHTVDSSWLSTLISWLAFLTGKPLIKEIVLIDTDDPLTIKKEKSFISRPIFLFPFYAAEKIITISEQLKHICVKEGIPEKKIWSRHNPIYIENVTKDDLDAFSIEGRNLSGKNILYVGTIIKRKNIDFLLDAAFYLQGKVNLLFAGPVEDDDYFEYLLRISKLLKEKTDYRINTFYLGWIEDRKKLAVLFIKSDLFWFASLKEGMGNVVIESLLYGTPVVTLPVCGIMYNIIQSDDEGRIIENNATPQDFAKAANYYLYEKKVDRKSLMNKSRIKFNPSEIEDAYHKIFNNLVNK